MNLEKKSETKNELLKRREIVMSVSYEGKTPSREEITAEASRSLGVSKERILIVKIGQIYGSKASDVLLYAYEDAESLKAAPKYLQSRLGRKKQKKAKAEKPAEEQKQAKAEEPKEEAAPVEKTE